MLHMAIISQVKRNLLYSICAMLPLIVLFVTHHFSQICNRAMALDRCQIFVSAQYLENKLTEFHQVIYAFILARSKLGL